VSGIARGPRTLWREARVVGSAIEEKPRVWVTMGGFWSLSSLPPPSFWLTVIRWRQLGRLTMRLRGLMLPLQKAEREAGMAFSLVCAVRKY
jgi:hypothetical protein